MLNPLTVTLSVNVDAEMASMLKTLSEEEGQTVSDLIRQALFDVYPALAPFEAAKR